MNWAMLEHHAALRALAPLGGFHPGAADGAPDGCGTIVLLGPDEPAFWTAFTASPEFADSAADAMDRWSTRVIGDWAAALRATPLFPFTGPPYQPFYRWALRSGRVHASPINLLVHDRAGLFVSFRGALALPCRIDLPTPPAAPCDTCRDRPCLTTCPVGALAPTGYDVAGCKAWLAQPQGKECLTQGCAARRACPVSRGSGRVAAQSAFHMRHFKGD